MGGSLPHGVPAEFYADAISQAHAYGVPVLFDSSGPSLLAGVKSHPDLIKPNLVELGELLGDQPASKEEVQNAACRLRDEYGVNVIVTLGAEGAIAATDEATYFVHPIALPVVSSAGAGDGVLAGMAVAYDRKESFEYGLRHGFALAGAILQTLPTADLRVEDYQELLPQIRIRRL
jgi:fructose-1-phosphate kinase PfkB-like protein